MSELLERRIEPCRNLEEMNLMAQELGINEFAQDRDPLTGEHEWLAPDGQAFMLQGEFAFYNTLESSPKTGNESFSGPRLSLRARRLNSVERIATRILTIPEDTPEESDITVDIVVKGLVNAIVALKFETIPFDIEGKQGSYDILVDDIIYTYPMAIGNKENSRLSFVPAPEGREIALPQTHPEYESFANRGRLELPYHCTAPTTTEALEQEGDLKDYMLERLGGLAGYQAHFRRMGTPFSDDPLAQAKDLMNPFQNSKPLELI